MAEGVMVRPNRREREVGAFFRNRSSIFSSSSAVLKGFSRKALAPAARILALTLGSDHADKARIGMWEVVGSVRNCWQVVNPS